MNEYLAAIALLLEIFSDALDQKPDSDIIRKNLEETKKLAVLVSSIIDDRGKHDPKKQ